MTSNVSQLLRHLALDLDAELTALQRKAESASVDTAGGDQWKAALREQRSAITCVTGLALRFLKNTLPDALSATATDFKITNGICELLESTQSDCADVSLVTVFREELCKITCVDRLGGALWAMMRAVASATSATATMQEAWAPMCANIDEISTCIHALTDVVERLPQRLGVSGLGDRVAAILRTIPTGIDATTRILCAQDAGEYCVPKVAAGFRTFTTEVATVDASTCGVSTGMTSFLDNVMCTPCGQKVTRLQPSVLLSPVKLTLFIYEPIFSALIDNTLNALLATLPKSFLRDAMSLVDDILEKLEGVIDQFFDEFVNTMFTIGCTSDLVTGKRCMAEFAAIGADVSLDYMSMFLSKTKPTQLGDTATMQKICANDVFRRCVSMVSTAAAAPLTRRMPDTAAALSLVTVMCEGDGNDKLCGPRLVEAFTKGFADGCGRQSDYGPVGGCCIASLRQTISSSLTALGSPSSTIDSALSVFQCTSLPTETCAARMSSNEYKTIGFAIPSAAFKSTEVQSIQEAILLDLARGAGIPRSYLVLHSISQFDGFTVDFAVAAETASEAREYAATIDDAVAAHESAIASSTRQEASFVVESGEVDTRGGQRATGGSQYTMTLTMSAVAKAGGDPLTVRRGSASNNGGSPVVTVVVVVVILILCCAALAAIGIAVACCCTQKRRGPVGPKAGPVSGVVMVLAPGGAGHTEHVTTDFVTPVALGHSADLEQGDPAAGQGGVEVAASTEPPKAERGGGEDV
eukprot:TRINITY_DN3389_c0_g1_i1.p1 TRINITY_DN3389_c0_g1~~TRINITY_DN3389_c0_g1_i1.p1  ORF type:complete len:848 (-),score=112.83 TRINITY_DN3389_c0_g1_i1:498-2756(-)